MLEAKEDLRIAFFETSYIAMCTDEFVMTMPKHRGKTAAMVFEDDPQYCEWCKEHCYTSENVAKFAAYVRRRQAEAAVNAELEHDSD